MYFLGRDSVINLLTLSIEMSKGVSLCILTWLFSNGYLKTILRYKSVTGSYGSKQFITITNQPVGKEMDRVAVAPFEG